RDAADVAVVRGVLLGLEFPRRHAAGHPGAAAHRAERRAAGRDARRGGRGRDPAGAGPAGRMGHRLVRRRAACLPLALAAGGRAPSLSPGQKVTQLTQTAVRTDTVSGFWPAVTLVGPPD